MTVLGERSPMEEADDLGPVYVIAARILPDVPIILADDAGALPVFAERGYAEACASVLRGLELPHVRGERLFESVAVAPCWRGFVAQTVARTMAPDLELTDEQLNSLPMRSYLFEAQTFNAADALMQCVDLAGRIAGGLIRRLREEP